MFNIILTSLLVTLISVNTAATEHCISIVNTNKNISNSIQSKMFSDFPALQHKYDGLIEVISDGIAISHPRSIPFQYGDQERVITSDEMELRAETLSPEITLSITNIYNKIGNLEELTVYFRKLFIDAATKMYNRGRAEDLLLLEKGNITLQSIASTLVKRAKAKGNYRFTTISRKGIKHGTQPLRQSLENSLYSHFRAVIAEGPFFDQNFAVDEREGHGAFSHMIQRDIVSDIVSSSTNSQPQLFWDFLGSKKGIHWWIDIFDSGIKSKSFHSPEVLNLFIMHDLVGLDK